MRQALNLLHPQLLHPQLLHPQLWARSWLGLPSHQASHGKALGSRIRLLPKHPGWTHPI